MQAKCAQCGLKFSGLEDFDAHRPGKPGSKRPCLDPAITPGWGTKNSDIWMRPGHEKRREGFQAYFAKRNLS